MNRIDAAMRGGRAALIAYLPVGDPAMPDDLADRYAAAGVDVLECGVAAREPFRDGETIRASMSRSLGAGVDGRAAVERLAELRRARPGCPLVAMTYPEHADDTYAALADHVDGLLIPVPARSLGRVERSIAGRGAHLLHFIAEDADPAGDGDVAGASGYVMVQAQPGRTGARGRSPIGLAERISALRAAGVQAPVAAGFGVATPSRVREILAEGADAVVVGSALVEAALAGGSAVDELAAALAEAVHGA